MAGASVKPENNISFDENIDDKINQSNVFKMPFSHQPMSQSDNRPYNVDPLK